MSDRDERGKDALESLSRRFGSDEQGETDEHDEQPQPSDTSKPSKPDEPDQQDKSDERDEDSVKDERVGTYMYLPEEQKRRIRRQYNVLKADYEFEFDDELEKNRHFYPLVAEYGLESLDGCDASDVREMLESNGWL